VCCLHQKKKAIHLPPKEVGVFLLILDKPKGGVQMNYNIGIKYNTGIRYNSPRPPIEAEGIIVRGANGRIVAILTPKDGLKDAEINNTLNGECTLSFSLPIDLRNVDKYGDIP